ncbi:MAG: molecular chaperone HtpG [Sandaracinaceae bacterium]|nr:molecular chaperone HtpG [Sandaracinaceae bacterium]
MTAPTTHKFEAEVEQVLRLVIESLYSNREVFLRELVSNAADALDKLRFAAVTDPSLIPSGAALGVRLIPDREANTLTISDNGIGMSREELVDHLGTIARSGTRELAKKLAEAKETGDLSLIGQFGVGFYSSYLVADRVEVVSRKAGTEEAHRWISEAKESFSVEPAERDEHGTSVILHLGEEHRGFLDPVRLRELIARYSDYLAWPVELKTTKKDGDDYVDAFEKINQSSALWQRPRGEIQDDKAEELYHHLTSDYAKPLGWRHFRIEGTQLFSGMIFVPSHAPFALWSPETQHGVRLYVKRVFIMDDAAELLPNWLRFVRGVVDSEDLPLNVSRELLQDSRVVTVIRKQLVKQALDLLGELAKERPDDYLTFWTAFGGVLKEGLHSEPERADELAPLLRFHSSEVEGVTSLAEAKERMKEGQPALYYVLGESLAQARQSPHIEGLRKKGYEVLFLVDPVDPFAIEALTKFDGTPLESASDAQPGETHAPADEDREAALSSLKNRFRTRLQDDVSEVRVSARLVDSPVCLVVPPGGLQPHIERLLRATQKDMPKQKRILEINPSHPVIENLRALLEGAKAVERVDEWIELLHDQAKIAEGSPLDDPGAYNRRVTALLKDATERLVGAE